METPEYIYRFPVSLPAELRDRLELAQKRATRRERKVISLAEVVRRALNQQLPREKGQKGPRLKDVQGVLPLFK